MGRPKRIDSPTKITLLLSAACHKQMDELVNYIEREPNRRTQVSRSEVVERAVAALHSAVISITNKRKK